jgi:hypothetical protein
MELRLEQIALQQLKRNLLQLELLELFVES